ncbi:MAG: tRNA (N(6)-L-threonylcarbamoyladenosine(37)-C(2))-methylthiotransferase MtaB [Phycisphaerae bacterium]|nr:tRNA (N(6)-L-threonylcarbamoyladenosine(37)-C(2))-methylthiotransferase MtaB [Phycisphaerae bacterium]
MKTFSIFTLGCKVNQYESRQIHELLALHGLRPCKKPDLIVVNSCCVTHTASAKSRQYITKAVKTNPNAAIVLCGCLPAVNIGELENSGKGIIHVKDRNKLVQTLLELIKTTSFAQNSNSTEIKPNNRLKIKPKKDLPDNSLPPLSSYHGQTRAFLKVQDGCDGFCTYCIIPKTRSIVHSRDRKTVISEAQRLACAGHKEIIVTGIFLGAYSQQSVRRKKWPNGKNPHLALLLREIAQIPEIRRIRLSSLEPADVTDELLDVFCNCDKILPHLHLSLQSGSDQTLKKMNRQYNIAEFLDSVDRIQTRLNQPSITTDLIVGFPGETEEDFKKTLEIAKKICFAKMHVFPFSARTGTAAAKMPSHISAETIKKRAAILRELDEQLGFRFRQRFIGQTANVLVEKGGKTCSGLAERYFTVSFKNTDNSIKNNDIVRVRLTKNAPDSMTAQYLKKP